MSGSPLRPLDRSHEALLQLLPPGYVKELQQGAGVPDPAFRRPPKSPNQQHQLRRESHRGVRPGRGRKSRDGGQKDGGVEVVFHARMLLVPAATTKHVNHS